MRFASRKYRSSRAYFFAPFCLACLLAFAAPSVNAHPTWNPVPYVSIISPQRATPGGQSFTLTLHGANFTPSSVVYWNSTVLATTYVSRGQLTAAVPANFIAAINTASIAVVNPPPRGGKSNISYFQVANSGGSFNPSTFSLAGGTIAGNQAYFYYHVQADLNGDGNLDLIGIDYFGYLWVFLGNGDGTFQAPVSYLDLYGAYAGALGDLNGDGNLDIVIAESSQDNGLTVHLGNGDGSFQPALPSFAPGQTANQIVLADMNGDGFLDIVIPGANNIVLYLGNGDGTFQSPTIVGPLDSNAFSLAVGDFNGDGILDVVAGNALTTNVAVFIGAGNGTFAPAQTFVGLGQSWIAATGDFNEDGVLDFVGGASSNTPSTLILNNPETGFEAASPLYLGNSLQGIAVADLNGDGHSDIIISPPGQGISISYGAGDGTFSEPVNFNPSAFYGESITIGNFVTAGGLGIAAVNYTTGGLDYFLPTVTISPSPLDFASVAINSTTPAQALTITNNTPTSINLTSTSLTGPNNSEFAISATTCGETLAAAASCTASVTFSPAAGGPATAAFNVSDSAAGGTQTAPLTGTGVTASAVNLAPANIAFQSVVLNVTSASHTVVLKNTGSAVLNIASIALAGANPADFATNNTCSATLAINATCSITATFTPSVSGPRAATITLTDDALDSPQSVALSGTGVTDTVSLSANSLSFNSQPIGSPTSSQSVMLTNVGSVALSIASVAITGPNSADFSQTNTCGASVAVQATCSISVIFTPSAAGSRTASVTITDGGPLSPNVIALSGTGQDFTFAVSAAQIVTAGNSGAFDLTVTPQDFFNQSISFTCTDSIRHSTCSVSPTSITPECSMPATVMLTITTSSGKSLGAIPPPFPLGIIPAIALRTFILLAIFAALLFAIRKEKILPPHRAARLIAAALLFTGVILAVAACDSSSTRTPPGSYSVTVTATSGALSHSVTAQVTVN